MNSNRHGHPRARLVDVAAAAGVSLGAASKALAQPEAVRPQTLAAVRAAVDKLGYVGSDRGRALASRFTGMVGIVLPTISNPVFATFVHELQKLLWATDHQLLALAHEYDRALEAEQIERLVRRSVDALILVGSDQSPATLRLLDQLRIPHLFTWSTDTAGHEPMVGFSNRSAMHAVADHLAALGHRRIAVLSGEPKGNQRAHWRLVGIEEASVRLGLEIVAIRRTSLTIEGGREAYRALDPIALGVTALVCATDTVAAGALDAAREQGIAVPDHLSISGFDDIELATLLTPALTTVRVPIVEMAAEVNAALRTMLSGGTGQACVDLPTRLVIRASTAAPAR